MKAVMRVRSSDITTPCRRSCRVMLSGPSSSKARLTTYTVVCSNVHSSLAVMHRVVWLTMYTVVWLTICKVMRLTGKGVWLTIYRPATAAVVKTCPPSLHRLIQHTCHQNAQPTTWCGEHCGVLPLATLSPICRVQIPVGYPIPLRWGDSRLPYN